MLIVTSQAKFIGSTTSTFLDDVPVFGDHVTAVDQFTSSPSLSHPCGRRGRPVFRGYLVPNEWNQPTPDIGWERLNCCEDFVDGSHALSLPNTSEYSITIHEQHTETNRRREKRRVRGARQWKFAGVRISGCKLQGSGCDKIRAVRYSTQYPPLAIRWKGRATGEWAMLDDCVPYLIKHSGGREISGLNAYEQ